jgi:hypothetical protein
MFELNRRGEAFEQHSVILTDPARRRCRTIALPGLVPLLRITARADPGGLLLHVIRIAPAVLGLAILSGCAGGHSSVVVASAPRSSASPSTAATVPAVSTSTAPVVPTSTTATMSTTAVVTPTTVATSRAPRVISIAVDAAAARATVTFDQPVRPGTNSVAPLYLVIYGNQPGCPTPEGNGQAPVSGSSTRVLSLPATSLVQGTNYVTIAPGFATSLSGTPNLAVGCTGVQTATAPIPPTTTTLPAGAPAVVNAVMDRGAGTVTVTFDQPVTGGQPMDLVVYEGDPTCGTPNGNAHAYLSGNGTRTITAGASSLVAGTSYITIASGWAVSATGVPNTPLGCTAIHAG